MTCKITARARSAENLRGRVRVEERITASVPRLAGPIVDGWYEDGVRQTRQFQRVLEELRQTHQPEHWASWALDGSLEEDAGRLPLVHSNIVEFVSMGPRLAAQFGGVGASAMWGTEEDFRFLHEDRVFTMGLWFVGPNTNLLLGTTDSQLRPGARIFQAGGRPYFDSATESGFTRITPTNQMVRDRPSFFVVVGDGENLWYWVDGLLSAHSPFPLTNTVVPSQSRLPMTMGLNAPDTIIWNGFATTAQFTDAEIYRLYVAGMQELMG